MFKSIAKKTRRRGPTARQVACPDGRPASDTLIRAGSRRGGNGVLLTPGFSKTFKQPLPAGFHLGIADRTDQLLVVFGQPPKDPLTRRANPQKCGSLLFLDQTRRKRVLSIRRHPSYLRRKQTLLILPRTCADATATSDFSDARSSFGRARTGVRFPVQLVFFHLLVLRYPASL